MRYYANFEGDEFEGKVYGEGEEVKGLDAGTLAYLVRAGRLTETGDEDASGIGLGRTGDAPGLPITSTRPVADMRRAELIGEARQHFEALIGRIDDDRLRSMVDEARSQTAGGGFTDLDPPQRDAMAAEFNAGERVKGNVEAATLNLDQLTPEQRGELRTAENARDGGPRKGVIDALDAFDK